MIELSCVAVDTATLKEVACFQRYCRPTEHPRLTPFCIQLTGIEQHTWARRRGGGAGQGGAASTSAGLPQPSRPLPRRVDEQGVPLARAVEEHNAWIKAEGLRGAGRSALAVTWGDWDMKVRVRTGGGRMHGWARVLLAHSQRG